LKNYSFKAPAFEDGNVHLFGAEAIAKHLLGANSQYLPQVSQFCILTI
jgi:hypothetical protein